MLYISHAIEEKEKGEIVRLNRILEEGIKPSIYTNQTNFPMGLGYDAMHNHNFTFFGASADRYKHIWTLANISGLIYLNNEYVAKHSGDFFNGTYRDTDGNLIFDGYIPSWEDTLNSKEFTSYCRENKITTNPINRIKRMTNQIVSRIVPKEAFESVVVFGEKALESVEPLVSDGIKLYLCNGKYTPENVISITRK